MTPLFVTIDGAQKELTSLPGMVDGVQRDMSSLFATVDGVAREIFKVVAKQIAFIINSTTYEADNGMTWRAWCESEYNTEGFYVDDIMGGIGMMYISSVLKYDDGTVVGVDDTIISGHAYEL